MNRDEVILILKSVKDQLNSLLQQLTSMTSDFVQKQSLKTQAQNISSSWFQSIEPALLSFGFSNEVVMKYHAQFDALLKLSFPRSNRKSSYLRIIQGILSDFVDDLLIPSFKIQEIVSVPSSLKSVISICTEEEREYLEEAQGCVKQGYLRAAVILGWSAAIDRIQRSIEKRGFQEFNKKSQEMCDKTTGRYKRFNKKFEISTLYELRASVFDQDLLWVLEYWGLIDSNQHDRLSACYVMRNNSAHPGEAHISEENLASFFSDLKAYIFESQSFQML